MPGRLVMETSGIITDDEAKEIVRGLELVRTEWAEGKFEIKPGDEDIHTANERRLTELIGAVGGKLHTGELMGWYDQIKYEHMGSTVGGA